MSQETEIKYQHLNIQLMKEQFGSDENVKEMLEQLFKTGVLNSAIDDIDIGLQEKDWKKISHVVHKLKGSFGQTHLNHKQLLNRYCHSKYLVEICKKTDGYIKMQLHSGQQVNSDLVVPQIFQLLQQFKLFRYDLQKFLHVDQMTYIQHIDDVCKSFIQLKQYFIVTKHTDLFNEIMEISNHRQSNGSCCKCRIF